MVRLPGTSGRGKKKECKRRFVYNRNYYRYFGIAFFRKIEGYGPYRHRSTDKEHVCHIPVLHNRRSEAMGAAWRDRKSVRWGFEHDGRFRL